MVASFSSSRWWIKIILRKAVFETHTNKFIFYKYISRLLRIGINHSCSKIFVSFFALYERSSNSRLCGVSTWYCFFWKNVYKTSIKKSYHFETVFGSCKCQCSTKKALLLNLSIFPFLHHPQDDLYIDDSFADVHALKPKSSFVPWAMFLNACFLEDLVVPSHPNNSIVSISFHCNRHLSTSFVTFSYPCPLALSLLNKSIHCQRHLIRSHFPVIIPS